MSTRTVELEKGSDLSLERIKGVVLEPKLEDLTRTHVLYPFSSISVGNEVVAVNNSLDTPFDFIERSPTELAFQLATGPLKGPRDRVVFCRPMHHRSAIITASAKIGHDGVLFDYLDAKGTGHLKTVSRKHIEKRRGAFTNGCDLRVLDIRKDEDPDRREKTWGLATKQGIRVETDAGNLFKNLQIRTVPWVAVAKINEVIIGGNRISIEEAQETGYVNQETEPVIVYRAWVTPFRLLEVSTPSVRTESDILRRRRIVTTAIEDIKHSDPFVPQDIETTIAGIKKYLEWLIITSLQGLGKMHGNGLVHGFLSQLHNTTLDARFTDLDRARRAYSRLELEQEKAFFCESLNGFIDNFTELFEFKPSGGLLNIAEEAYYTEFPSKR